jgi:ribonuclease HI
MLVGAGGAGMIGCMADRIIAACDGACKGNPGPAGWGWVIADPQGEPDRWEAGPLGRATNNIAELTALQRLLEATEPAVPLEVRMDSQYAMKAVTVWLPSWKKRGWRTAGGTPVANKELVTAIDALLTGRTVDFVHVAAHRVDGDRLNAFADRAASEAALTQRAAGTSAGSSAPAPAAESPASQRPARSGSRAAGPGRTASAGARTLKAKFPGTCRCGRAYAAGESIAKNADGWGHPACREATA